MPTPAQNKLLAEFQAQSIQAIRKYVDGWQAGQIPGGLADLQVLVKEELRGIYLASAWTARGTTQLTAKEYGRSGPQLREQYKYLAGLFEEISRGQLSREQVEARLAMYVRSSRQQLEATAAGALGIPTLPHYPGDGSTRCLTNCNCSLEFEELEYGWRIHWRLSSSEHCDDCTRRASKPLIVAFGQVSNPEAWD